MISPVGTDVRTQAYYDTLAKDLDRGMLYYNPKTKKTIFSNKQCTAVIDGTVPHGTRVINGKLDLSLFDRPQYKPELPAIMPTPRKALLFNNPSVSSKAQSNLLEKVIKLVLAQEPNCSTGKILFKVLKHV